MTKVIERFEKMHGPVDFADIAMTVLQRIRERSPRVHCITNTVAQQFTANVLLAAGAVPSMTLSPQEIEVTGGRIDLRGDLGVGKLVGDLIGLAELAFDLDEKRDHARASEPGDTYIIRGREASDMTSLGRSV